MGDNPKAPEITVSYVNDVAQPDGLLIDGKPPLPGLRMVVSVDAVERLPAVDAALEQGVVWIPKPASRPTGAR